MSSEQREQPELDTVREEFTAWTSILFDRLNLLVTLTEGWPLSISCGPASGGGSTPLRLTLLAGESPTRQEIRVAAHAEAVEALEQLQVRLLSLRQSLEPVAPADPGAAAT